MGEGSDCLILIGKLLKSGICLGLREGLFRGCEQAGLAVVSC